MPIYVKYMQNIAYATHTHVCVCVCVCVIVQILKMILKMTSKS